MDRWTPVGNEGMLTVGTMTDVAVGDETVLLVRLDDGYHAMQERCPHRRAHLSNGTLADGVITCPWHGSRFEASTGRNLAWVANLPGIVVPFVKLFAPPKDLRTYPVKVEDGQVWIDASVVASQEAS
jgi:nitrite reductase/ring-hydroxylating ferredoxin subunit